MNLHAQRRPTDQFTQFLKSDHTLVAILDKCHDLPYQPNYSNILYIFYINEVGRGAISRVIVDIILN